MSRFQRSSAGITVRLYCASRLYPGLIEHIFTTIRSAKQIPNFFSEQPKVNSPNSIKNLQPGQKKSCNLLPDSPLIRPSLCRWQQAHNASNSGAISSAPRGRVSRLKSWRTTKTAFQSPPRPTRPQKSQKARAKPQSHKDKHRFASFCAQAQNPSSPACSTLIKICANRCNLRMAFLFFLSAPLRLCMRIDNDFSTYCQGRGLADRAGCG